MLRAGDSTTGAGLALLPNTSSVRDQHNALSGARLIDEISRGDAAGTLFSSDSIGGGGDASTSGGGREEDEAYRKALSRAMRLINFRERSSGELQGRLLEDGYDPRVVARVVLRMRELGLQDDDRFARMFARGRWRSSARAPAQIARELRQRGVGDHHIKAALEEVFGPGGRVQQARHGDDDEEEEEEDQEDVSPATARQDTNPFDELVQQAGRWAQLSEGDDIQKRSWDTIKRVMKEVGL
ncbi:Regulatory protein recX [Monoraphidium neglectum]|uniref:Regulatory protein RecX n=1 Tax=Monoraphidium neglectum TaxID=145388 RepID=A0A0D2K5R4_9CHLO|nr:Regulatory protein recX [Monoraphidium neglectum]KIZ05683.1 Regulatory protein recX [Monoraphidium neglectum]|eukprot:XP_013904702.1 Regulatory protein recX [Monoraphidium neglectum]